MITHDHFRALDLRIAKVVIAERVAGSEKLVRLELDAGDKGEAGKNILRQIVAGIGKSYEPEQLVGKQIVIVANLEARKLMGLESNGMLLAAHSESGTPIILVPQQDVSSGAKIS